MRSPQFEHQPDIVLDQTARRHRAQPAIRLMSQPIVALYAYLFFFWTCRRRLVQQAGSADCTRGAADGKRAARRYREGRLRLVARGARCQPIQNALGFRDRVARVWTQPTARDLPIVHDTDH